jgi:hypothetical protein
MMPKTLQATQRLGLKWLLQTDYEAVARDVLLLDPMLRAIVTVGIVGKIYTPNIVYIACFPTRLFI